jgi:hypothetical membrane protein
MNTVTSGHRDKRRAEWLGAIVIACVTYYALAVVALHVLRPEYDPISRVTSNYAVGPYGYLMTATFFAIAAALLALSFGLSRTLASTARSRVGFALLSAAGAGAVIAGVFPTDVTPDDSPVTIIGGVHILAGVAAFVCVTAGTLLVSRRLDRDPEWRASRRPAFFLALVIVAGFLLSVIAQSLGGRGIGQRFFLGTVLLWLLFMAIRLRTHARTGPGLSPPTYSGAKIL